MLRVVTVFVSFLLLFSCASLSTYKVKKQHNQNIGLRIAIIADTQLTTDKLEDEYMFRTRFADKVSNVAIRTTAQEFLALEHLGYFFNDIKKLNPDVVLYLGDGMNSGCRDEVDLFFGQLEKARTHLDKPIFFVIGNHDYLATGNQIDPDIRQKTCGTNNGVYTKGELIVKIEKFNTISYTNFNKQNIFTRFRDNIAVSGSHQAWEIPIDTACDRTNPRDQHKATHFKCFYAGILEYSQNGVKGQIVLADTSDYRDIVFKPEFDVTELYGTVGGISWEAGGQSDWINKNLTGSNDVRIIASHYKVDQLGYTDVFTGRPGDLLLKGNNKNLWLSGHTHLPDPNGGVSDHRYAENLINNAKTVHQINVGSTTDYLPHFAIVESNNNGTFKTSYPSAATWNAMQCDALINSIQLSSDYLPVFYDVRNTRVLLGLTGDYRDRNYNSKNARANLNKLLAGIQPAERERYTRCLLYVGAKAESKLKSVQE